MVILILVDIFIIIKGNRIEQSAAGSRNIFLLDWPILYCMLFHESDNSIITDGRFLKSGVKEIETFKSGGLNTSAISRLTAQIKEIKK
jgi:hypothetical protein